MILQSLSPFLQSFVRERLGTLDWKETKATCENCLCSEKNKKVRGVLPYYSPHLKCCTFHPFVPNYAVGAILETPGNSKAKQVLLQKIQAREYTLPLGACVPVKYQVDFNNRNKADFGNNEKFLCPYFDCSLNQCGIWEHRGSVCTSYWCVSDRGDLGLQQWSLLGDYLHTLEMTLAQDAMASLGFHEEDIYSQFEYINCQTGTDEEMSSFSMNPSIFESYWQPWGKDYVNFYTACNTYVTQLTNSQILELLPPESFELEERIMSSKS